MLTQKLHQIDSQRTEAGLVPLFDAPTPREELHLDANELSLLLIEDEPSDTALACEMIREGMPDYSWDIQTAASMDEAITMLFNKQFDLALVDLGLGDVYGARTVDLLCMVAPYLPIIVYSGTGNTSVLEESVKRGALNIIHKNHMTPDLVRNVITAALTRGARK